MKIHFYLLIKDITISGNLLCILYYLGNKITLINVVEYKEIKSCIFIKCNKSVITLFCQI